MEVISTHRYNEDPDAEDYALPEMDLSSLTRSGENRVSKAVEGNRINALINTSRIVGQSRTAYAGLLCQAKLDEVVTHYARKNLRPEALSDLEMLSRANALRIVEIMRDDDWRWKAGIRLLNFGKETDGKRKRAMEPSATFLRHMLAVAECFVQVTELCKSEPEMHLKHLCIEPECWRTYTKNGKDQSLRPDLYAETINGKYEDHWFIEMDLGTEDVQYTIMDKCRRYYEYYQTDKEQQATGVFPIVLWIVQTKERRDRIIEAINGLFSKRYTHIFVVATPEELLHFLRDGVKMAELC